MAGLLQGLGLGDLIAGIAGLEANRLGRRSHGRSCWPSEVRARLRSHCARAFPGWSLIACSASCRLNSGRRSMFVSARSTKGSAVIGSRTICVTFLRRLSRIGSRLKGKEHSALRIGLAEDLAQLVGNQYRLDLGEFQLLGDLRGRETAFEADHQRSDLLRPHRPPRLAGMDRPSTTASIRRRASDSFGFPQVFSTSSRVLTPGVMPWKLVTSISAGPRYFESGTGPAAHRRRQCRASPAGPGAPCGGALAAAARRTPRVEPVGRGRLTRRGGWRGAGTAVSTVVPSSGGNALPSAKRTGSGRDCPGDGWPSAATWLGSAAEAERVPEHEADEGKVASDSNQLNRHGEFLLERRCAGLTRKTL